MEDISYGKEGGSFFSISPGAMRCGVSLTEPEGWLGGLFPERVGSCLPLYGALPISVP